MGKIKLEKRSGPAHHSSAIARVVVVVTLPVAAGPRAEVVDAVGRRRGAVTRGTARWEAGRRGVLTSDGAPGWRIAGGVVRA